MYLLALRRTVRKIEIAAWGGGAPQYSIHVQDQVITTGGIVLLNLF